MEFNIGLTILTLILFGVGFAAWYLKDISSNWAKVHAALFQERQRNDITDDAMATLSIKEMAQDSILRELTLACKGKDLAESLEGIKQLKEMAKEK